MLSESVSQTDSVPSESALSPPRRRSALWTPVSDAVAVAIATTGLMVVALRLWEADWRVPFLYNAKNVGPQVYGPDGVYYLMLIKSLIVNGRFLRIPGLGWPFGLQLFDNPESGDQLQLQALRALGSVLRDPALTMNVYFLLTFVAVSLTAWFVLRRLGVSRLVAGVVAILYSFLPYHFARGEGHLLLSGYFMVPIAVLLIMRIWSSDPPFTVRAGDSWRVKLNTRPALGWLVACVALGSTGPYYAFFAVLLIAGAVVLDVVTRNGMRSAASGGVAIAAILLVLLVNLSPSFLYWAQHGTNDYVAHRGPSETEVDGLRVAQLVLPRQQHRIPALASLQRKSDRFSPIPSERGQQLGLIAALGFLGMLVVTLGRVVRRPSTRDPDEDPEGRPTPVALVTRAGILAIIAILFGAVSGFSLVVAGSGLRPIRSWNRLSIFIGFFALIAVAFALDWFIRRLPRWRNRAVLAGAVCLAVLAVGLLDQTSPADVPNYAAVNRAWRSDEVFMHNIAQTLGPGTAVFQLPYVFFPEAGFVVGTGPYDQVRGWLHASSLRWSWGSMHGREGDWQGAVTKLDPHATLDSLAAVGFSGILIDRAGYADHARVLEYAYSQQLHERPRVSSDHRLAFFDLRGRVHDLRGRLDATAIRELRRKTVARRDRGRRPVGSVSGRLND